MFSCTEMAAVTGSSSDGVGCCVMDPYGGKGAMLKIDVKHTTIANLFILTVVCCTLVFLN